MAFTTFFTSADFPAPDWPPWLAVPPGWQWRTRWHVKRTLRGRHRHPYSLSTHTKARQVGPVPLPFKPKRRRRNR
jgi:hypothetical protein